MTEDTARNNLSLKAWNEWKKNCSVGACSEAHQYILQNEIGCAFRKKIAYINSFYKKNFPYTDEYQIYANEFDIGILEYAEGERTHRQTGRPLGKKNYKNVVWGKTGQSKAPALKIIRGMLIATANKKSVLNAIVYEYLRREFDFRRADPYAEKFSLYYERDGEAVDINLPVQDDKSQLNQDDKDFLERELKAAFSWEEALVLEHHLAERSINDSDLLYRLGKEKSQAYKIKKTAAAKSIEILMKGNYNDAAILPEAIAFIRKVLKKLSVERKK